MSIVGTTSRSRRFNLPTQQRRLRHLRSIAARNIFVRPRPSETDVDVTQLDTYLTLHDSVETQAFYETEKIRGSLNPSWRSFNLQHIGDSLLNTASTNVIVRVWRGTDEKFQLIMEWHVNLTGLVYIGDKLQQDGMAYRPNMLIFGMLEGYYSQPSPQTPCSSSGAGTPSPQSESGMTVDSGAVRDSYGTNSLSRIQTVLRAIKQTQASVQKVRRNIEDTLSQSQRLTRKKREKEMLLLRVSQLRSELQWRTTQLQGEKEMHETTQANIHQRDVSLKLKHETLAKDKERLHEKKRSYFDVREDLIKTGAQLVMRRKQLISELALIYPVQELQNGDYTICGVKLPNSEDFSGQDETMVAVALGFTVHLVQMINTFLDVPLRYPMEHRVSRSRVTDHIHDKLTEKDRDFPLYSKGKERFQFNYGVYLLNKNIAQLRYYCGLGTTDLRLTLPNLKSLLELRLGVKFDPATNSMSVTPSQNVPLPPNLGGPQKLTSNFSSRLNPRPELLLPEGKTPSRSESEDSKFEQMIEETQRHLESAGTAGVSTASTPDSSYSHKISSREQTPSEHSERQEDSGEELFKASPDSFFEVNNRQRMDERSNEYPGKVVADNIPTVELEVAQDALDNEAPPPKVEISDAPEPVPQCASKITVENVTKLQKNKPLVGPLDGYIDSDISSTEENINAAYGSKFKMWPREQLLQQNSDNEHQHSGEEESVSATRVGHLVGLSSNRCEADLSYPTMGTFKTGALVSQPRDFDEEEDSIPIVSFTASRDLHVRRPYDDICERTDALTSSFATFKVKLPQNRDLGEHPVGALDDAVPSSGNNRH